MKTLTQVFHLPCLTVILLIGPFLHLNAQVITRVLAPNDNIQNYIHWYSPSEDMPLITTPSVDVQSTILNDKRIGRSSPRIAIRQDLSIAMRKGSIVKVGKHAIWNLRIASPGAKSLSFRFEETKISEKAIMYLYNEETRFVVGPISANDFRNGVFRSDYINGSHVNITVFIPNYKTEITDINISSFDFGIVDFGYFDNDFYRSGDCNVNTSCPEGIGWDCEINSVCLILTGPVGTCSGALINNDCCDLTPYILTAQHCIIDRPVEDFIFRFKYESPNCMPNGVTYEWIVFHGAEVRSQWHDTDFALLELFGKAQGDMAFAGWDRTATPNHSSVACIHHPAGDVKKISIDNETPIMDPFMWLVDDWDIGTTEDGSSGSPLFDINHHIIGQDYDGDGPPACDVDKGTYFGRFDLSWDGGGTASTRLSDWLGSFSSPNTLNCQKYPTIQGLSVLCNDGTYELINNMPCAKSITWSVSPTILFDSPTSGSGTIANLSTVTAPSGGLATLTFTLTGTGCAPIEVKKSIWVGKPAIPDIQVTIDPCLNIIKLFDANYNPLANSTYQVILTIQCGNVITPYNLIGMPQTLHLPFKRGCQVCLELIRVSNSCGTIFGDPGECQTVPYCGEKVIIRSNEEDQLEQNSALYKAYPNPTGSLLTINLMSPDIRTVSLYDITGRRVFDAIHKEKQLEIDLSNFNPGVYLLIIQDQQGSHFQKIIKS